MGERSYVSVSKTKLNQAPENVPPTPKRSKTTQRHLYDYGVNQDLVWLETLDHFIDDRK